MKRPKTAWGLIFNYSVSSLEWSLISEQAGLTNTSQNISALFDLLAEMANEKKMKKMMMKAKARNELEAQAEYKERIN